MDVFTMVVAIVAISFIGKFAIELVKKNAKPVQPNPEWENKFEALEERVQVLEQIVTDSKSQLREKIDAL